MIAHLLSTEFTEDEIEVAIHRLREQVKTSLDKGKIFKITVVSRDEEDCYCTGFQHHPDCKNHWANNGGDVPY